MPDRIHVSTLYLVRHGEPSLKGVLLGRSDPLLSEVGRSGMAAVHLDVAVVYCSPLHRARESAELIGAPVRIIPDLAEISLGAWDGRSWPDIEAADPELAKRKLADWTGVTPPGGERWEDFVLRVDRALEIIRNGPEPAAVVAHLAVNAWIAHRVAGVPVLEFRQDYCEVYEYPF